MLSLPFIFVFFGFRLFPNPYLLPFIYFLNWPLIFVTVVKFLTSIFCTIYDLLKDSQINKFWNSRKNSYLFKSTYQTFQVWHIIFLYQYVSLHIISLEYLIYCEKENNTIFLIKINIKILKVYQNYYVSHIWENWALKSNLSFKFLNFIFFSIFTCENICFPILE